MTGWGNLHVFIFWPVKISAELHRAHLCFKNLAEIATVVNTCAKVTSPNITTRDWTCWFQGLLASNFLPAIEVPAKKNKKKTTHWGSHFHLVFTDYGFSHWQRIQSTNWSVRSKTEATSCSASTAAWTQQTCKKKKKNHTTFNFKISVVHYRGHCLFVVMAYWSMVVIWLKNSTVHCGVNSLDNHNPCPRSAWHISSGEK